MVKKKTEDKEKPTDEMKNLIKENEALKEAAKRIAADFDNYRRRQEQARQENTSLATNGLIMDIFPILDNFRRASEHTPSIEINDDKLPELTEDDFRKISAYFEGIRQIEKQLENVLAGAGLTRIDTFNQVFDPHTMEAIAYEPHPELPENTVIGEVEGGYKLGDKVVRPAKVRVSSGQ